MLPPKEPADCCEPNWKVEPPCFCCASPKLNDGAEVIVVLPPIPVIDCGLGTLTAAVDCVELALNDGPEVPPKDVGGDETLLGREREATVVEAPAS